jgi:hypothetical protein
VQTTGSVPAHAPPWHASACVHALPSLHADPSAFGGFEQVPLVGLHVPGSWHWSCAVQTIGAPAAHAPL